MRREIQVLALAALLFLCSLGGHDLWAPDEPYFAAGAREMVVDGHWLVPHVNGVVTTDKPPGFFWSIALLSLPGGAVTAWTARLPSVLAAFGTLLLLMRLARRHGGERTAWLAGGILCTTLMFWEKARWAQTDSLLCCCIWVALSAFEAWRSGDADGRRAGLLFWLAAAVATLVKGPVGVLLPLGIALTVLVTDRRLRSFRRFAPLAGPLLFAVVVGLWVAAAALWGSGEYSVWAALKEHFIDRGIHGLHHRRPPWYYLRVLPVQLLPWSGLVPGALLLGWRGKSGVERFLLGTCVFVVLFFSVSTEKRDLYVLPAVPAFAFLVARFVESWSGEGSERGPRLVGRRWLFGGQIALASILLAAGSAVPFVARGRTEVPYWMPVGIAIVLVAAGGGTLWACRNRLVLPAALAPASAFAVCYLFVAAVGYPALEHEKSARAFSLEMKAATAASRAAGHQVVAFDLSNLPEAFALYSDGVYTLTTSDPQVLIRHLEQPDEVWAVMDAKGLDALPPELRRRLVVVDRTELSRKQVLLVRNG